MERIYLKRYQLQKLQPFNSGIVHMESNLYYYSRKKGRTMAIQLLKLFKSNDEIYLLEKKEKLESLWNHRIKLSEIEELILPDRLMYLDDRFSEYTQELIQNAINLSTLLHQVSFEACIMILQAIGYLIEKIIKTKILFLDDIHEANFIYDQNKNQIRAVDLDSAMIKNRKKAITKYLTENSNIEKLSYKYDLAEKENKNGNVNRMYASYIYMILNTISGCTYINCLSIEDYYRYLTRLCNGGYPKELIDIFSLIYTPANNKNPVYLLEEIAKQKSFISIKGI